MGDAATTGLTARRLPEIVTGRWLAFVHDTPLDILLTDTRHLPAKKGVVFFAIAGANHDGHDYISFAYQSGVRTFIVERGLDHQKWPEANFWQADSSILALQELASYKRQLYKLDVVGITGSNGKTIVKEWISAIVQGQRRVVKSPKSYNSQIGVPLSVWQMNATHDLGVFEAGISMPGEMERLASIIRPTIGLLTNLGSAHDAGFISREAKLREKVKLFAHADTIIYCADHSLIDSLMRSEFGGKKLLSWSSSGADALISIVHRDNRLEVSGALGSCSMSVPFSDRSSLENIGHVIVLMQYLGLDHDLVQKEIAKLRQVRMRLELKEGVQQTYLIDDSYNNDLSGLRIALGFLAQQQQYPRKTLVLSPIEQASVSGEALYGEVAELLNEYGIHRLIGIGPEIRQYLRHIPQETVFYDSLEDYFAMRPAFGQEVILIKGARHYHLERVVADLQQKRHDTCLEINLEALVHNLNVYRQRLSTGTRLMVMVKAMAYGSGIREIAQVLQHQKVDYLGVAYADEGVELRKNGITLPIMVMNPSPDSFPSIISHQLQPEIYDLHQLQEYILAFDDPSMTKPPIHIKLETGMHRLGILPEHYADLITLLSENNVPVAGILTHLAGADEPGHDAYSHTQVAKFLDGYHKICRGINAQPVRHVLNSPGLIRFPQYHFDMVRLGIGIYGFDASHEIQQLLRVVATLKTYISRIATVDEGATVGYGRTWTAARPTRVATLPVGYADGYRRLYSNGVGKVYLNGQLVPIVGKVCMDMCMIDVTDVSCHVGDEVIIFGQQPSIQMLAEWADTIPYEILTNVSSRVRRTYVSE